MNLGIDLLPGACDVIVVGAGPAGAAAALSLARGGAEVVLIDQHAEIAEATGISIDPRGERGGS